MTRIAIGITISLIILLVIAVVIYIRFRIQSSPSTSDPISGKDVPPVAPAPIYEVLVTRKSVGECDVVAECRTGEHVYEDIKPFGKGERCSLVLEAENEYYHKNDIAMT